MRGPNNGPRHAGVAELADAQASGACDRKAVRVQVPSPALGKARSYGLFSLGVSGSQRGRFSVTHFLILSYLSATAGDSLVAKQGDVTSGAFLISYTNAMNACLRVHFQKRRCSGLH